MSREKKPKACYASVGGQALMGGISMRTPTQTAFVVRLPNGKLHTEIRPAKSVRDRFAVLRWPVIRGVVNFVETLITGYHDLMRSAELSVGEDEEAQTEAEKKRDNALVGAAIGIGSVLGIVLAVAMMFVLPTWLTKLLDGVLPLGGFKVVVESLIKIIIFVAYVAIVSRTKEIREVFMYHGAEHKSIFCHEKNLPLTVENVRAQSRFHPRCGTSFIIIMVLVSMIIFAFVTWENVVLRVALKLLTLPLVMGIGYEILKFCGRHDNWLTKILSAPGIWFQHLTTCEPDRDEIIEVGIASLEAALGLEITVPTGEEEKPQPEPSADGDAE